MATYVPSSSIVYLSDSEDESSPKRSVSTATDGHSNAAEVVANNIRNRSNMIGNGRELDSIDLGSGASSVQVSELNSPHSDSSNTISYNNSITNLNSLAHNNSAIGSISDSTNNNTNDNNMNYNTANNISNTSNNYESHYDNVSRNPKRQRLESISDRRLENLRNGNQNQHPEFSNYRGNSPFRSDSASLSSAPLIHNSDVTSANLEKRPLIANTNAPDVITGDEYGTNDKESAYLTPSMSNIDIWGANVSTDPGLIDEAISSINNNGSSMFKNFSTIGASVGPEDSSIFDNLDSVIETSGGNKKVADVEVISLDSDEDDDEDDRDYTLNGGDHVNSSTADPSVVDSSAVEPTIGVPILEEIEDSDDDLMIIDEEEATKLSKFKETTFGSRIQGQPQGSPSSRGFDLLNSSFNRPAPVPHTSDFNYSREQLVAQELRNNEKAIQSRIQASILDFKKSEQAALNGQRVLAEAYRSLSGLESQLRNATSGTISEIRSTLDWRRLEVEKAKKNFSLLESKLNDAKRRFNSLIQSRDTIRDELRRLGQFVDQFPLPSSTDPIQVANLQPSYQANVYSDSADLQNLLDNIQPDEELEKDVGPNPEGLSVNLMKHQRLGLNWLIRMEKSSSAGGILADDMGLGKTVQTIALLVAKAPEENEGSTTLIVAPVSLLRQWAAEINTKVRSVNGKPKFKVGIYHGIDKKELSTFRHISEYNVILTSYGTLSSEWKRHFKEALEKSKSDKRSSDLPRSSEGGKSYVSPFFEKETRFHRIILDEAQQIKNKLSLASKAVVSLKGNFRFCLSGTPIQNNVDELFPILRFLDIKPYCNEQKFRMDISLPLKSKNGNFDDFDKTSSMNKLRAILKAILLRRSKTTLIDGKPILTLPEKHLHSDYVEMDEEEKTFYNSLEEGVVKKAQKLMSRKQVGAASGILTLLLRLRQACCHQYLVEIGEMRANSKTKSRSTRDWTLMYRKVNALDSNVTDRIMHLAGEKRPMPELDFLDQNVTHFSGQETSLIDSSTHFKTEPQDFKGSILDTLADVELSDDEQRDNKNNIHSVGITKEALTTVTKVESSRDGELSLSRSANLSTNGVITEDGEDSETEGDMFVCPICLNAISNLEETVIFQECGHMICQACVDNFFEDKVIEEDSGGNRIAQCPYSCTQKVAEKNLIDFIIFKIAKLDMLDSHEVSRFCHDYYRPSGADKNLRKIHDLIKRDKGLTPSAKISKCVDLLTDIFEKYPGEKVIIFSQFTTLFDIMKLVLDEQKIRFLRYDGSMSIENKNATIKRFYQEDIKVLLLSLRAGNVGLTLTCASHVVIMDPFWNPYVEEQAMDRAYRIGQEREVHVHRILIAQTVESRIMELQEMKKEIVGAALDENGMKSVSRLGQRELGFLFGLNSLREDE
ncbi:SNF2 family N-terminal domain-containing protein [Scheffersomyces xylosifermentans]|uniref:SNF2 family N-terminal domain-containing protein n=1 Tax=Scheffersomyces xylosifermentans TaxID=1304137 RepID=UPI00315C95E8